MAPIHVCSVFLIVITVLLTLFQGRLTFAQQSSQSAKTVPPYDKNCSSPHGRDCTWYRRCLEKTIPCSNSAFDYAIAYGETLCNYNTEVYDSVSPDGQRWIGAVRKCLQAKLAPELTRFPRRSCRELHDFAINNHASCYVNPGDGGPSFCDLDIADKLHILYELWLTFTPDSRAIVLAGLREAPVSESNLLLPYSPQAPEDCVGRAVSDIADWWF